MPDFPIYSVRFKTVGILKLTKCEFKAILLDSTGITLQFDLHPEPLEGSRRMSDFLVGDSD